MDLSRERWEGSTPSERETVARRLARQLPAGFAFDGIERHRMGEQQNHLAVFHQGTSTFALVPGGPVMLGFDAERPLEPTADELESWQDEADFWSGPDDPGMHRRGDLAAPLRRFRPLPC